jgi:SIR2-like domain
VLEDREWDLLLDRISDGKCTPFLGAGACYPVLPMGAKIAGDWAQQYKYPLEDSWDLVRVAQFLAYKGDAMTPKEEFVKLLNAAGVPDFSAKDELHGLLAELPLPLYITTNYDNYMSLALRSRNRNPHAEICRWSQHLRQMKDTVSVFDAAPGFVLNKETPVVFHLHGYKDVPESLVLTEDDYLDFLVNLAQNPDLLPMQLQRAVTGTSLLFLGYRIADWNFRVLFRSLITYLERNIARKHISVQLIPLSDGVSAEQKAEAQAYLDHYYGENKIRVYWGKCANFASELRQRWTGSKHGG